MGLIILKFLPKNGCPLLFGSDSSKSSSAAESNESLAAVIMITIATDRDYFEREFGERNFNEKPKSPAALVSIV